MADYSPNNPFAPANLSRTTDSVGVVDLRTSDVVEVPAGVDTATVAGLFATGDTAARLQAIADVVRLAVTALDDTRATASTLDDMVAIADASKELKSAVTAPYDAARVTLWEKVGAGKHATETGRVFSFRRPNATRSTDYAALAKDYPDAYEACVATKPPKPDAVGTLSISAKKG